MMKRILAMILAAVLLLGVVPVWAEETESTIPDGVVDSDVVEPENPGEEVPVLPESISALAIIHNIAAEYAQINLAETEGNLSWILADMAVYEELFPESEYRLTTEKKEEGATLLVDFLSTATAPGDLAKGIIALRSLGYDARNLYTKNFEKIDAVKKLTDLVDAEDTSVTNMYTLPYVIMALSQMEGYSTKEQRDYLVNHAVTTKQSWQSTMHPEYGYMGTDGITPMILALAPFCRENVDVATAVGEAVANLKAEQREEGLINGFEGYEPASTGLAICAISAMGEDAQTVTKDGSNLIDGILSCVNENQNGFPNVFATEQGFRGLLAWQLLAQETGKIMYDFSDYEGKEWNLTGVTNCPVVFELKPELALVVVEGKEPFRENSYDLPEGTYSYTVSYAGYLTASGVIIVTAKEQEEHILKTIPVVLTQQQIVIGGIPSVPSGGISGGGGASKPVGGGSPGAVQPEESPQMQPEQKPAEMVLTGTTFPDVKEKDWYFTAVKYVYENGLFQGTEEGFEPESSMSRAMLVTVLHRFAEPEDKVYGNAFLDVPEGQWYSEGIKWAAENGIVSGVSENTFDPDAGITREQLALILYRYALFCGYETTDTDLAKFEDADEISDYALEAVRYAVAKGIIGGKTEKTIAPKDGATRAEVATMLMRFAGSVR